MSFRVFLRGRRIGQKLWDMRIWRSYVRIGESYVRILKLYVKIYRSCVRIST